MSSEQQSASEPLLSFRSRSLTKPRPVYHKHDQQQEKAEQDYAKLIETRYKTYTWDKKFDYTPIDTSRLRSLFLADNADFQNSVFFIEQYNKEITEFKNTSNPIAELKHGPWKMRFHQTLANILKEVVNTHDKVAQKLFAIEAYNWAHASIQALEQDTKQLQIFDGDPSFLSFSFQALAKDYMNSRQVRLISPFQQRNSRSEVRPRPHVSFNSINLEPIKQAAKPFGGQTEGITSSRIQSARDHDILDESTRDNTKILADGMDSQRLNGSSTGPALSSRIRMRQPSEIAAEELADYENNARTKNPEYDPPKLRLKEFKRRVLSFDQPSLLLQVKPQNVEEKSEFAGIVYPKPISFQEMKRRQEEEEKAAREQEAEEEAREQGVDGATAVVTVEPGTVEPLGTVEDQKSEKDDENNGDDENGNQEKEKSDKPPLQPNIKNFTDDIVSRDKILSDLNARFDQRSNYTMYEPSKDVREIRMEQKWVEGRQRELREKRENQEMIKIMGDWSLAKGRLDREINRKIDSSIFGSKFKDCEYRFVKKTTSELRGIDARTKEKALQQNAVQEMKEQEEKLKVIEQKKKERVERRKDREQRVSKIQKKAKNKVAGGRMVNDDSDDEGAAVTARQKTGGIPVAAAAAGGGTESGDESFDEDLDGPFTLDNPIVKARPALQAKYLKMNKNSSTMSVNLQGQMLPMLVAKQKRSISNPVHGLEADARRQKIIDMANLHGKLIGINVNEEKAEGGGETLGSQNALKTASATVSVLKQSQQLTTNGLSIYSRDVVQKLRPFSAIFDTYDISAIQSGQLSEVVDVKNRMAKYKIALPYKKLKDAILIPEGFTDEADLEELPEPGQGLISNPFMKEKKKKKKKKKSG